MTDMSATNEYNIVIVKADSVKTVGSILWKYASGIEGADNYMLTYNIKENFSGDGVDNAVLSDSWENRTSDVAGILSDFLVSCSESGSASKTFTIRMSARWNGTFEALQASVRKYVTDAMLFDWLTATAPSQAALYGNKMQSDIKAIEDNIYNKKAAS